MKIIEGETPPSSAPSRRDDFLALNFITKRVYKSGLLCYTLVTVTKRDVQIGGDILDSKKIARTLIDLRGNRSREEVASALGLSLSTIAMYEIGARIPRDKTKMKIAEYYGKSVEDIFFTKECHKE